MQWVNSHDILFRGFVKLAITLGEYQSLQTLNPRRPENISQDVFKASWNTKKLFRYRGLEDVLKTCLEDVLKTCLEDVFKTSWRQTKCLLGISVSNHSLLTNLNQYLTNLYFTNLYFTNLRRIQNELISIFVLFWDSISRINSKSTLKNRWDNKIEVSSNILHKYIERLFILTYIFNLHLKNIFAFKKSPIFANLLMEKPGNWFAIAKSENNTWRRKKF